MADDWTVLTLREAGVSLTDCDHRTPPASLSGYPYVAIPQLREGRIELKDARRISSEHFLEWTRKAKPSVNDVVLSRRCNPGETAFVPDGVEFALGQNLVLLRADGKSVYPPFLRWLTRSPEWWAQVRKFINVGAVFDSLRCADIPKFELTIPPLVAQRTITHVLAALDSKIELNRRRNETLEAMARALFQDWFVDFGPVRAKMEGREPYLPADLWQLFPERLDEQEAPDGWGHSTIGSEVTVCGGSTPSTKEPAFWDGGEHHWATPKDLSKITFPVLLNTDRKITGEGLAKISSGLLPVGTVLLSSRAPIGYLAIADVPTAINQGFIAMKCNGALPNVFVLFWCRQNMDLIIGNANGSTFQEISKSSFRPIPVIVPPEPVMDAFQRRAEPLYRHIVENERESIALAQLRDTLLPKLISGELRIKDAERFMEQRAA